MKPNEHMKSPEDELIAQIKASLSTHEEEYVAGSWEKFNNKGRSSKGLIVWISRASAIAAAILIGFSVFLFVKRPALQQSVEVVKVKEVEKLPLPSIKEDVVTASSAPEELTAHQRIASAVQKNIMQKRSNRSEDSFSASDIVITSSQEVAQNTIVPTQNTIIPNNVASKSAATDPISPADTKVTASTKVPADTKSPVVERKKSLEDFLAEESKANKMAKVVNTYGQKQDKWEVGFVVAPSFGNSKKLNMGYGVSMGYALSDKVSISSGISYNQMGASRDIESPMTPNMPSSGASLVRDTKELRSVDANLRGIDIPLEIKYHLSKKLYANVGVSAFAVLDQKQKNNFLESKLAGEGVDGADLLSSKTMIISRSVSENVPKDDVREDRYLGFYNLSFGYKQTISKGKSFAVEPFLKLPIKEFTKENLYLIGTGVKLKFDF